MVVMTSEDGYEYTEMLPVSGEVPPQRYTGLNKNFGPQYFRGIVEGNGNPPGDKMYVVFSNNKEDVWIANITVPIKGMVDEHVNQDFNLKSVDELNLWNLYSPKWAPVEIVNDFDGINKVLQLKDEEPYDYAKAERIFPESKKIKIEFRINQIKIEFRINPYGVEVGKALEIEVESQTGDRAVRLRVDNDTHGSIPCLTFYFNFQSLSNFNTVWIDSKFNFYLDGKLERENVEFGYETETVSRIVFRTGPYRNLVPNDYIDGYPNAVGMFGEDLPAAGRKVTPVIYWIDDFKTIGY